MNDHLPQRVRVERRSVSEEESRHANGPDWDRYADEYQATHGGFLGDTGFVWGPEGLREEDARVLGEVDGRDVLELGSGAGQCSRWVRVRGGTSYGLIFLLAACFGLQNATVRRVAPRDLTTTVLTMTLTGIAAAASSADSDVAIALVSAMYGIFRQVKT